MKGNSSILADSLTKGAKDNGTNMKEFFLHEMNIKPSNACDVCIKQPEKECILKDDMHEI